MQSSNKRIARNTLMLYIRTFVMMPVSLYTSRIILEVLGENDFGVYNVVGGFIALLSFINSAMTKATQRFLNVELGKGNHDRVSSGKQVPEIWIYPLKNRTGQSVAAPLSESL